MGERGARQGWEGGVGQRGGRDGWARRMGKMDGSSGSGEGSSSQIIPDTIETSSNKAELLLEPQRRVLWSIEHLVKVLAQERLVMDMQ